MNKTLWEISASRKNDKQTCKDAAASVSHHVVRQKEIILFILQRGPITNHELMRQGQEQFICCPRGRIRDLRRDGHMIEVKGGVYTYKGKSND